MQKEAKESPNCRIVSFCLSAEDEEMLYANTIAAGCPTVSEYVKRRCCMPSTAVPGNGQEEEEETSKEVNK